MPVGTIIETGEVLQSAGFSAPTGTAFIVAPATYGPEAPTLVRSPGEAFRLFGPREGESLKLYDAISAFFAIKGARAYVNRTAGEGAPAAAKLEIGPATHEKTLVLSAKYKGTYGNGIKVAVIENEAKTKTKFVVYNPEGEVLEQSGEYAKAEELLAWGKEHQSNILITEGSEYSTEKGNKLAAKASTKLASGANPTSSAASTIKTIEGLGKELGPGTLIVPGNSETSVHIAMAEHCQKNNRFALADMKKTAETGTTAQEVKEERETNVFSTLLGGYIAFFSTAITATGVTLGTTRTIPASPVAAGLMAQIAAGASEDRAPAGPRWPLSPFVTGFVNNYTEAQINELNEAGVNCFTEKRGVPCLFGDVTATPATKDRIFWQYSASRERMRLAYECEIEAEAFDFVTIDGRGQKKTALQGVLQGVCKRHWEANALYGLVATEAYEVKVGEPVNTPTTEQAGELNAEVLARISPVAQLVKIALVSVPIVEAV
jgi:hypothetical protein